MVGKYRDGESNIVPKYRSHLDSCSWGAHPYNMYLQHPPRELNVHFPPMYESRSISSFHDTLLSGKATCEDVTAAYLAPLSTYDSIPEGCHPRQRESIGYRSAKIFGPP
jgi:hypothetical protein